MSSSLVLWVLNFDHCRTQLCSVRSQFVFPWWLIMSSFMCSLAICDPVLWKAYLNLISIFSQVSCLTLLHYNLPSYILNAGSMWVFSSSLGFVFIFSCASLFDEVQFITIFLSSQCFVMFNKPLPTKRSQRCYFSKSCTDFTFTLMPMILWELISGYDVREELSLIFLPF